MNSIERAMLVTALAVLLLVGYSTSNEVDTSKEEQDDEKGYVIDGVLAFVSEQLRGKGAHLPQVSETFTKQLGLVTIVFRLSLTWAKMTVEDLLRQGPITYSEVEGTAKFRFHAYLENSIESNYILLASETELSKGVASARWGLTFNATLRTNGCNLELESPPMFASESFVIELHSADKRVNVSYSDDPVNVMETVYLQSLQNIVQGSFAQIPICEAIQC